MTLTKQKKTNEGTKYTVILPSQKIIYNYDSAQKAGKSDGENEYWNIYTTMSEVCNKGFPLNANPRKPNSIGSDESKDIVVKMENGYNIPINNS